MIALLRIRRLAREYGWTPGQILEIPAQLVRDLILAGDLARQLER